MVPFARGEIVRRLVVISIVRLRLNVLTRASLSRAGECGVRKLSNNEARRVSWGVLDHITEGAQEIFVVFCRVSCERQVYFRRDSSSFTLATVLSPASSRSRPFLYRAQGAISFSLAVLYSKNRAFSSGTFVSAPTSSAPLLAYRTNHESPPYIPGASFGFNSRSSMTGNFDFKGIACPGASLHAISAGYSSSVGSNNIRNRR